MKFCKALDVIIELSWGLFYAWLFTYGVCTYTGII